MVAVVRRVSGGKPPQMTSRLDKQMLLGLGPQHQFELKCEAEADPPAEYVWYKDAAVMEPDTGLQIDGGTLRFSNPSPDHEGYYHCLGSNPMGVAKSDVVHITQTYTESPEGTVPPSFIRSPESEIKNIGGRAEFECSGEGEPKPTVTWYKNGEIIDGETGKRLVVPSVEEKDVANYACNISNIAGYEYKDVYLNILNQRATIVEGPKEEKMVSKGSNVTMKCQAEGYPKPTISWEFENNQIISNEKYMINKDNGDLVIREVGTEDEGVYRCTASNYYSTNQEGNLIVKSVTTIDDGPRDTEVTVFSRVRMNCTVMYDLSEELTVSWKKDNRDLEDIGYIQGEKIHILEDYALVLMNVTFGDAGTVNIIKYKT